MLFRNKLNPYIRPISFVLGLMLLLSFFPAHFHLHHTDDEGAASHQHIIDLHVITDVTEQDHHGESHIVKASADGLIKQLTGLMLSVGLILSFLVLFPPLNSRVLHYLFEDVRKHKKSSYRRAHPLRAPPA